MIDTGKGIIALILALTTSACGGGGGGGSGAPAPPVNTAPSLSVADSFSILEGSLSVGSASASDAQGNTLSYTLSGTDAELFSISASGTISFKTAPDYESPTDGDANNDYELSVSVSDGSLSARATTIINVADAFEGRVVDGPVAGASVFIDLNGDSQQDADEPSSATDSSGYFFVEGFTATDARIIASGGTDTVTNADLSDVALVADVPSDISKVASVTPITTVLAGAETEEQKNQVLAALGVSGSVEELLTTDHWALAESGDTSAQAIQATNQQIAIVLQTAATIIESDTSTAQVAATTVATSVAEQVTSLATSTGSVDLSSAETVTTLLTNAVEAADSAASTAAEVISAVATSVAEVNTLIASDALDPTSAAAATIIETAQTTLQTSVAEVSAGTTDAASFITSNSTSTLFADNTVLASQPDFDGDGIADIADLDDDNDGTNDNADAFPLDATETLDTDNDGTGNNADTDDDADGVADTDDAFPLDATETLDTDNDGTGNNADTDDDADGVPDTDDAFPMDATETLDTDNDGTGNNADTDDDADGVADTEDAFPLDATETLDTDNDGTGNNADTDDDADGVADSNDAFPLDATETLDTDNDGTGNNADTDDDADGVADSNDAFPLDAMETLDTDNDGTGNNADTDDDADGVADSNDAFPLDATETLDTDIDGIGNNADDDDDNDGTKDSDDLTPFNAFPWDEKFSTARTMKAEDLPVGMYMVADTTQTDPNFSQWHSGDFLRRLEDGTALITTNDDWNQGLRGTWSVTENQLQLRDLRTYNDGSPQESFPTICQESKTNYTNINEENWDNKFDDSCVQAAIKYVEDRDYWLLDNANNKNVMYERRVTKTFFADASLHQDPSKPVLTSDPNYRVRSWYDEAPTSSLVFSQTEVVGTWALPIDIGSNNDVSGLSGIKPDIVTFKADGTGNTKFGKKTFTWTLDEQGGLSIVFNDSQDAATIRKRRTFTDYIGVSVFATHPAKQANYAEFSYAFKQDTNISDPSVVIKSGVSHVTSDYRYLPFDITSDDRKDSLLELFTFRLTEDNVLEHRSLLALADSDFIDKGDHLYKVDYDYRFSNGVISGSSCRGTLSDTDGDGTPDNCDGYARHREIHVLKATNTRLYAYMRYQIDPDGGDYQPDFGSGVGSDYLTIFESLDPSDIDSDGVTNAEDPYPLIPDDVADTDSDGQPNECNDLCRLAGLVSDNDDDNDRVTDALDAFPLDNSETLDTDGDGIGNRQDSDDDNDGILDSTDGYPLIPIGSLTDTDQDGFPDTCNEACQQQGMSSDIDSDNDGFSDDLETKLGSDPKSPISTLSYDMDSVVKLSHETEWSTAGYVALNGDGTRLAIGAPSVNARSGSHVRIYDYVDERWNNTYTINSPTDIYNFGIHLAFDNSGSTLAIQGSRSSLEQYTGVFRYNDDNDNWVNLAIGLAAQYTGMLPSFNYGQADISKDGRRLAIGTSVGQTPPSTPSGFVDVYELTDDAAPTWRRLGARIQDSTPISTGLSKSFGANVAMSNNGNVVAVTAPISEYDSTEQKAGSVRVFEWDGSDWIGQGSPIFGQASDCALYSDLSADGKVLSIGFPGCLYGSNAGAVKVFRRHRSKNPTECSSYTAAEAAALSFSTDCNVSWQQIGSSILGLAASNQMGSHDLTEDGSLVVVADPYGGRSFNTQKEGLIRSFKYSNNAWKPVGPIISVDRQSAQTWQIAQSDDGSVLAVGAPAYFADVILSGIVQIYRLVPTVDTDADGYVDVIDDYPDDPDRYIIDTDSDGIRNAEDPDDDNDLTLDDSDAFPLDATESVDSDSDGIGNNADTDDDNDGVNDESDAYPLTSLGGLTDTDNDGRPDNCDADCQALGMAADDDDDGDGITDGSDAYPLVSLGSLTDTDSDGRPNDCDTACQALGMTADADDDDDGVEDTSDAFPLDNTETVDTDSDGIGNNADTDDDNDGVSDTDDAYPLNADIHTAPTATNATLDLNLLPQTTNTLTASLTSTSQNSRAVTYAIVSTPTNGTLTLSDAATGAFTYSTTATTAVVDSFTFKVNDGVVDSATGTVYINLKTDPLYKYQWHLDNVGQTSFATNAGTTGADLNLDTTIAAGKTGTGIVIAVIDDGLDIAHEDLTDNVVANGSYNYLNASNDPTPTLSADGHGTAVAGIIAARGWNNIGVRGVAPNASLRAFNLLANSSAAYSSSNEANALGAGSSELFGDVSIFNMSYGGPSTSLTPTYSSTVMDQLYAGVTNLRSGKGAIYIASAGNNYYKDATGSNNYSYCGDGTNAGSYKIGCYDVIFDKKKASPYIINVAALDADGLKAKYSTPGSATWVSAPAGDYGANSSYTSGVYPNTSIAIPYKPAITTTDLSSCMMGGNSSSSSNINAFNDSSNPLAENANCNYRNTMSGTSSAAPMVSGVVALMLEANSALTWRDVKHILATTATQVDTSFSAAATNGINYVNWVTNSAGLKFHPWYGFGAVDATAAVNAATSYTTGSLGSHSFTDWLLSSSGSTSLNDGVLNTLSLTESGSGTVEHVRIAIKISHSEPNHLGFRLESPAGTVVTLLPPLTALATDLSTGTWAYLPTNAFYGESKTGTWKLYIYDHYAGSTGTFAQWGIRFMYR